MYIYIEREDLRLVSCFSGGLVLLLFSGRGAEGEGLTWVWTIEGVRMNGFGLLMAP